MGILLGALAGAGDYIAKSEQEKIKNLDQQELEAQRANLLQSKEMALAKLNQELKDTSANASRTQMVSAIDQGAKKIVNDRMAGNQVADASTWTPEQEAARNQGMGILSSSPRVRSQAAANAGYTDEAVKLYKVAESGAASVPWGSTRVDSEGNVIYDNGAALKGEINRDRADAAALKASGAGKTEKVDHFDAKEWNTAFGKMDKAAISIPDPNNSEKVFVNHNLSTTWRNEFNAAKERGDMSPNEAVAYADSVAGRLRDRAIERVEKLRKDDPKSTRTVDQEIQSILQASKTFNQPKESPKPPPKNDAPIVPASKAAKSDAKPAGILTQSTPQADTGIEGLSTIALRRIAQDPKNPLYAVAKAALEKQKRENDAMQYDRVNDPQFDPALYTN